MDNPNQQPMNRQNDHLGVNKMGKNIKKSPLHQPNFGNTAKQQPQPQVYNINKNDFRNIVQQLTGSPSREPPPRPPQNNRKPPNNRLMRVRPPPLAPSRPQIPVRPQLPIPVPAQAQPLVQAPYANNLMRPPPPPPSQFDQPSPAPLLPPTPTDVWTNTTESPISIYMRYLQNSIMDSGPIQNPPQPQPRLQPQVPGQNLPQPRLQPQVPGQNLPQPQFHPNPAMPQVPSPRVNGPSPALPSPRMNGPSPRMALPHGKGPLPNLPSPRMNGPPLLPSPTSQFLLPSPSGFVNILSPRSPYPLLSPVHQHVPPISPTFSFSSAGQLGILGPGPHPPPSPGCGFPPLSPAFFPISSPRWRDQ